MARNETFSKYQASATEIAAARTARAIITIFTDYRFGVQEARSAANTRHEAAVAEYREHGRSERYRSLRAAAVMILDTTNAYSDIILEQQARFRDVLPETGMLTPLLEREAATAGLLPLAPKIVAE